MDTTASKGRRGTASQLAARIVVMTAGVCLVACAIALARHAQIGTSAINSPAAVTAEAAGRAGQEWLTLGVATFVLNSLLLLGQVALLRSRFRPYDALQLPLVLGMSVVVDLWAGLFEQIVFPSYPFRVLACLVAVAVMALGVYLQLQADLLMAPGDAFVRAVSQVTGHPYSRDKVLVDVCLVTCGAVLSLTLMGGLFHVREGTLISALLVGPVIALWGRVLGRPVSRLLGKGDPEGSDAQPA